MDLSPLRVCPDTLLILILCVLWAPLFSWPAAGQSWSSWCSQLLSAPTGRGSSVDQHRLCGSAPAVPQLFPSCASAQRAPLTAYQRCWASPACREAQKVGDSLKFSNSREGSVALKVFCDCFWNLGMARGSLVAADVDSKRWRR